STCRRSSWSGEPRSRRARRSGASHDGGPPGADRLRATPWVVAIGVACAVTAASIPLSRAFLADHEAPAGRPAASGIFDSLTASEHGAADAARRGEQKLERWRWVDRDARVVAIPLDRAMDVVASEETTCTPVRARARPRA